MDEAELSDGDRGADVSVTEIDGPDVRPDSTGDKARLAGHGQAAGLRKWV